MQKAENTKCLPSIVHAGGQIEFQANPAGEQVKSVFPAEWRFLASALQFGDKLLNDVLKILCVLFDLFSLDFMSITLSFFLCLFRRLMKSRSVSLNPSDSVNFCQSCAEANKNESGTEKLCNVSSKQHH